MWTMWERISAVVDSGVAETILPTKLRDRVQMKATPGSEAGFGTTDGEISRSSDGRNARSMWQVADVKRPLISVAQMITAGNCSHLDHSDPRVIPL